MKVDRDTAEGRNAFTGYGSGYVAINGRRIERSVLVRSEAIDDWTVASVGQLAPEAHALESVERLLGLRIGQEHGAIVTYMNKVVGAERVSGFRNPLGGLAFGAQAEDDPRCDLRLCCGRGRACTER